jgi:FkbM family methyltransferase
LGNKLIGNKLLQPTIAPSRWGSWLLGQCLGPASPKRRLARRFYKALGHFLEPAVLASYYSHRLIFPGRHDLPLLANDLPLFNTPLRRLAQAIRLHDGILRFLDVGANVGDGFPLVDPQASDIFWLVEGSSEFLPYLHENVRRYKNVTVIPTYLGEFHEVRKGTEVVTLGNARIVSGGAEEVTFETLDSIFQGEASPPQPNLLKIDVEGHEAPIFAGGRALLRRLQPVVFMEWHPRLLGSSGSDLFASLDLLREAGFTEAIIYDNHGYLLGECRLDERRRLEHLAQYAGAREMFYYDLAVFSPAHASLAGNFRASETIFYSEWIRGRMNTGP